MDAATIARTYTLSDDVWSLAPSPRDAEQLITSSARTGVTTLWRATGASAPMGGSSEDEGENAGGEEGGGGGDSLSRGRSMSAQGAAPAALEKLASLGEPATGPGMKGEKVTWQSSGGGGGDGGGGAEVVATACRAGVKLWELSDGGGGGGARLTGSFAVPSGNYVEAVAFDPHHPHVVSAVHGRGLQGFDTRTVDASGNSSARPMFAIPECHKYGARDVDYNPNKPLCVVTCGDDRLVKFWDLRSASKGPVRILVGHGEACATVRYNGFHDQLLLSGGCEGLVNLWRVSSVSSAPLLELSEEPGGGDGPGGDADGAGAAEGGNGSGGFFGGPSGLGGGSGGGANQSSDSKDQRIRAFGEGHHSDAVYSVAWSASDAWVFASVDFQGNVSINNVPSTEKYKILL
jgi:WD40 repeat protein